MIVKVDVDGVIRNMFDKMCSLYNALFEENKTVDDIKDYDVDKSFPKIKEKLGISANKFFFECYSETLFLMSEPYDDVVDALEKLHKEGHKIVIVTWQPSTKNKHHTLTFLEVNHIPYDDICFTKDKWLINGDWLIDDNPEFICDTREKADKVMINYTFNKDCDFPCKRLNNLKEAVDYILTKNNDTDK